MLLAGRSEVRLPEGEIFLVFKTTRPALGPTYPQIELAPGTVSWGQNNQGVKLTSHLHPVLTFRMSTAIPLLPLYPFMAGTGTVLPILKTEGSSPFQKKALYLFPIRFSRHAI
jgi:hypothetical protein